MSPDLRPRRVGSSSTDVPVTFIAGELAGRTIRGELEELQKADLGRKYARKDRRPLDPPPVIRLRLFEVIEPGTPQEYEREFEHYDETIAFGLICHLDAFPVRGEDGSESLPWENAGDEQPPSATRPPPPPAFVTTQPPSMSQYAPFSYTVPPPPPPLHIFTQDQPMSGLSFSDSMSSSMSFPANPFSATRSSASYQPTASRASSFYGSPLQSLLHAPGMSSDIAHLVPASPLNTASPDPTVAYFNDFAITESSKCTRWLIGTTFSEAAAIDYQGENMLIFVFPDIAVQLEGTFVLRYRAFNVFSQAGGGHSAPILAESYGGPFKVYSTKEFPGLHASTNLTKHLSMLGIRTHIRENERKRRKKSDIVHSPIAPKPATGRAAARHSWTASGASPRAARVAARPVDARTRMERRADNNTDDEDNEDSDQFADDD
ncbi:hypothetical protein OBBRIDRAFT_836141 [Obba rivulosa]|uniref:Velvet domain-containing protein n=1 Tax=Obba rivulosa TaxID=1052685 RepID=A0A8E2AQZ6_9APHY|nr:hypothetical protein OBBRIDRAFT_836141 [Obba rivulosa]